MKTRYIYFSLLWFTLAQCSGRQIENDLVILTVSSNRVELMNALSIIKSSNTKFVFPSEVVLLGTRQYRQVSPYCSYLWQDHKSGFINLITDKSQPYHVEKVQLVNVFDNNLEEFGIHTKNVSYHMSIRIASALDFEKTTKFLKEGIDTLEIDFGKPRKIQVLNAMQLAKEGTASQLLNNKVVIMAGLPQDLFLVPKSKRRNKEFRKMSTAEIFANIAYQILEK
jgi:hypothetical protein